MNEAETRADHVDPELKAAGWGVVEGSKIRRAGGIEKIAAAPGLHRRAHVRVTSATPKDRGMILFPHP